MNEQIGAVAGEIWSYLDEHGETSVNQLRLHTEATERLFHMALGWLAREGKIDWRQQGRALHVLLA